MSVDQATVKRVARLARLKVNDEDLPKLAGELNAILGFVEQLNEVVRTDRSHRIGWDEAGFGPCRAIEVRADGGREKATRLKGFMAGLRSRSAV